MMSLLNTRIATIACGLVLAGCASQRPAPTTNAPSMSERERQSAAAETELARMEAALRSSGAEATPDCPRVCGLVANICELARKLCDLAKQDGAAELQRRCADATPRCERARTEAASRCDCQSGGGR